MDFRELDRLELRRDKSIGKIEGKGKKWASHGGGNVRCVHGAGDSNQRRLDW